MTNPITDYEVIILGGGGAGLMCAIEASKRGRLVAVIDHTKKVGGKILISGGGRCNFTNIGASPSQYVSQNPHFCKSALSRFTPAMFIEKVKSHDIPFHEKKLGQQFCDRSAQDIVNLLTTECKEAGVHFLLETKIITVNKDESKFLVITDKGNFSAQSVVVATGGLSIPKIGATGIGYDIAKKFKLGLIERAPALDGFAFTDEETMLFRELAGVSIDCLITCNNVSFRENILFTHSGLSGPAALQASLHWYPGDLVAINFLPDTQVFEWFLEKKKQGSRSLVKNLLSELLPHRFVEYFCQLYFSEDLPLPQVSEKKLKIFCEKLHCWKFTPGRTIGYSKAEVTRGGVDTSELSSKTMESKKVPGLYFIGEVLDVTGWLGGYNFQWAWASGWVAGQVV